MNNVIVVFKEIFDPDYVMIVPTFVNDLIIYI